MEDFENLSEQEQDNLLRQEILASESGTNDSNEEEETQETETTQEETSDEVQDTQEKPKQNKVAKILSEKNEWKRQAQELKRQLEEKEANLWNDREWDLDYFDTRMEKKMAEKFEEIDFFNDNPEAKEIREELNEFRNENPNLSLDRAYKLYLAETNPSALLDKQTRNKLDANKYNASWHSPTSLRQPKELDYSDAEFERLAKEGKIKF